MGWAWVVPVAEQHQISVVDPLRYVVAHDYPDA